MTRARPATSFPDHSFPSDYQSRNSDSWTPKDMLTAGNLNSVNQGVDAAKIAFMRWFRRWPRPEMSVYGTLSGPAFRRPHDVPRKRGDCRSVILTEFGTGDSRRWAGSPVAPKPLLHFCDVQSPRAVGSATHCRRTDKQARSEPSPGGPGWCFEAQSGIQLRQPSTSPMPHSCIVILPA